MSIKKSNCGLPVALFAAAFVIGAAPAAYAQCEAGAGGSMIEDMAATQQSGTAGADTQIQADQGGVTTDQEGATTAQSGGTPEESGAATSSGETQAAMDSPEIEGPDEERIVAMLEEQGYSEVSSVTSCGAYYEVEAMQNGEQAKLQVDMASGRINPMPQ